DPLVTPMPVRDLASIDVRKLRVGFFVDDGLIRPSLAVQHAIHQSVSALEGAGVEVVPFAPPAIRDAIGLYLAALGSDGGKTAFRQLEGTAIEPTLEPLRRAASLPPAVRSGLRHALVALGQERVAWVLSLGGEKTIDELWQLTKRARDYRLALVDSMRKAGISAILCPPHATAALPHGKGGQFLLAGSYSMLFNLVQFPAGVVPVGTVLESEAQRAPSGTEDRFELIAREVDSEAAGLPVGVQIAAPPFHDEEVLSLMLALERALAGSARPKVPRAPA
ncbi:MAG: amidase, partial [Myxococcales bacterium]|nr:amidase [Myxococcales bacterium]